MKRKVLIISKSSFEISTDKVIDWIHYFKQDFFRLNGDIFESQSESIFVDSTKSNGIFINGLKLSSKYYSIWIRRWSDYYSVKKVIDNCSELGMDPGLVSVLASSVYQDIFAVNGFILNSFHCEKYLSNINQLNVNKLNVLKTAQNNQLHIPKYIITNRKKDVVAFLKEKKVILKDISSLFSYKKSNNLYLSYGELLDSEKIKNIPENFFPSFFQEYIEKQYEIRIVFLNGKFYSMAIFSQSDQKTQVDFRRYNDQNPNRTVPYKLPKIIEKRLLDLMKDLELQTGSIDILKGIDGEYYFLEVNPVGQFGMVSFPCNYNIEREIAKYLIS